MQLKEKMLEAEMVKYLKENAYFVEDEDGCVDSTLVVDYAIDLGYESYSLEGLGELDQTLIFIRTPEPYFVTKN